MWSNQCSAAQKKFWARAIWVMKRKSFPNGTKSQKQLLCNMIVCRKWKCELAEAGECNETDRIFRAVAEKCHDCSKCNVEIVQGL